MFHAAVAPSFESIAKKILIAANSQNFSAFKSALQKSIQLLNNPDYPAPLKIKHALRYLHNNLLYKNPQIAGLAIQALITHKLEFYLFHFNERGQSAFNFALQNKCLSATTELLSLAANYDVLAYVICAEADLYTPFYDAIIQKNLFSASILSHSSLFTQSYSHLTDIEICNKKFMADLEHCESNNQKQYAHLSLKLEQDWCIQATFSLFLMILSFIDNKDNRIPKSIAIGACLWIQTLALLSLHMNKNIFQGLDTATWHRFDELLEHIQKTINAAEYLQIPAVKLSQLHWQLQQLKQLDNTEDLRHQYTYLTRNGQQLINLEAEIRGKAKQLLFETFIANHQLIQGTQQKKKSSCKIS